MSSTNGYTFYFDTGDALVTFPITPGELEINTGSNNSVVTLINEGDVNILKSPSLIDVKFEARFPMRKYPYSKTHDEFQSYYNIFKQLKEEKKSFRFIVARTTPGGKRTWDTNLLMALESLKFNESADEGDDVLVEFELKQYKEYGVKILKTSTTPTTTSTSNVARSTGNKNTSSSTYTVQSGDCLWNIAKAAYGDGSKWISIYEANKTTIENVAKSRGKKSSSNGHWIFPNTKLVIPGVDSANLNVKKLKNNSNKSSSNIPFGEDISTDMFSG